MDPTTHQRHQALLPAPQPPTEAADASPVSGSRLASLIGQAHSFRKVESTVPAHSTTYLEAMHALTAVAPELTYDEVRAAVYAHVDLHLNAGAHDPLIMFVAKREGFRRKGITDEELIMAGRGGVTGCPGRVVT